MIAAWSIDRPGRSMQHPVGFLGELQAVGCLPASYQDGESKASSCSIQGLSAIPRVKPEDMLLGKPVSICDKQPSGFGSCS